MLNAVALLIKKDITLILLRGAGLLQPLLLGLIIIFLFSKVEINDHTSKTSLVSIIFWLASLLFLIHLLTILYSLEETTKTRLGLISMGVTPRMICLAKSTSAFTLLIFAQIIFILAILIFFNQDIKNPPFMSIAAILLTNTGLISATSMLGPLALSQTSGQSLMTVIFLPFCIPALLAGINLSTALFASQHTGLPDQTYYEILFLIAYDLIFAGLSILLFPILYKEA